jgi:hypothetical protein
MMGLDLILGVEDIKWIFVKLQELNYILVEINKIELNLQKKYHGWI